MKKQLMYLLTAATLAAGSVWAVSSGESLQQALYAEQIEGDLPAAIAHYQTIIDDPAAPASHIAQALYHQGMCYMQLKQNEQAETALSRLCTAYPGQTDLVEKAKPVLNSIRTFDPATLMPPETLAYLELGSTGKQLETVLEMLRGTPLEDPLLAFSQNNPDAMRSGPGALLAGLLNPAMKEEMQKVRGLAVGLIDVQPTGPDIVGVLHLGDSPTLRSLLMTGLSMAARPGPVVEGVQTYSIEGQVDIACDSQVFMFSIPPGRLPWMIRQYKHLSADASLASANQAFRQLDKKARQQNLATVWMDADGLYAKEGMNISIRNGAVNISSIDDLMLTASLAADTIGLDGRIRLKEQNVFYDMVRTPTVNSRDMNGVPADAFALLSMNLADSSTMQAAQLRQLALGNLGVDLPAELIDSLGQITLFALPGEAAVPEGMPFRLGLVMQFSDPAPVTAFVDSIRPMLEEPGVQLQVADGVIIAALEPEIIQTVSDTLAGAPCVTGAGRLNAKVTQLAGPAEKMAVIDAAGLVHLAGIQAAFHSEANDEEKQQLKDVFAQLEEESKSTTIAVITDEQPDVLELQARVSGIPPLSKLLPAFSDLQEVFAGIEQRLAEEQAKKQAELLKTLLDQPPARIVHTAAAPAIDGELDDVWTAADAYDLAQTIYVNPGSGEEIAADYRMLWDAEKLYVLIDVTDSSPVNNPDQIWQFNDGIELYLDAAGSRPGGYGDLQYQFGLLWNANDATAICAQEHGRSVHAIETGLKNTEKGYCFEVAFLWSELGVTPATGTSLGVEVQVNDNRGRGGRDAKISWHDPSDQAWLNPQYFGRAVLK